MAKVSICIPAYKQAVYMRRLLDSISMQNYLDYEIIISDDSPDYTVYDVLSDYHNLKIIYQKNNISLGSPENWNESIRLSSGEYIKIMHHDDWFANEDSLYKFVKMLDENPDSDFAFSGSLNVSSEQSRVHFMTESKAVEIRNSPDCLFTGNFIGAPSATIYRRKDTKFDENLKWLVDLEFYIRLLRENNNFIFTTEPLVSIGISETQVTNDCINNRTLENFEYTYVYDKLNLSMHQSLKKYLLKLLIVNSADILLFRKNNFSFWDYYSGKMMFRLMQFNTINYFKRILYKIVGFFK